MDNDFVIFKKAVQSEKMGMLGMRWGIRKNPDLKNAVKKNGKYCDKDGNPIKAPPQWKGVQYNPDPKGDVQLVGTDSKGRMQVVYSELHNQQAAKEKFARIDELDNNMQKVGKEINADMKNGVEEAHVLNLIKDTGIRPGSETDTGADKQAYGATTLETRHIFVGKDGNVTLQFIGKKGVDLSIPVEDEKAKSLLIERKKSLGKNDKVFDTDSKKLLDYTNNRDGGGFLTKDFRTWVGTSVAKSLIKDYDTPKTAKEKKAYIKEIATEVSKKLGNTPTVALQKYIDPRIFSKWSKI